MKKLITDTRLFLELFKNFYMIEMAAISVLLFMQIILRKHSSLILTVKCRFMDTYGVYTVFIQYSRDEMSESSSEHVSKPHVGMNV